MHTLRHHVLVLQKIPCAQSFPRPYLERGPFTAIASILTQTLWIDGAFGKPPHCFHPSQVCSFHTPRVSAKQQTWWSPEGSAGAGQDILHRASKNTRVIRLQVQWVRMSQAWVGSHYFQCNSWESSLLVSPELRQSFLRSGEQNLLIDQSGIWQVDGPTKLTNT